MMGWINNLTFVAEGRDYVLMVNDKGDLVRVEGLFQSERDRVAGRTERKSSYAKLIAKIAELQ